MIQVVLGQDCSRYPATERINVALTCSLMFYNHVLFPFALENLHACSPGVDGKVSLIIDLPKQLYLRKQHLKYPSA
jgi:hypothetical protein